MEHQQAVNEPRDGDREDQADPLCPFFRVLFTGQIDAALTQRATSCGSDLLQEHVIALLMVEPSSSFSLSRQFFSSLSPVAAFFEPHGNYWVIVIRLLHSLEETKACFDVLCDQGAPHDQIFVGISAPCRCLADYTWAYQEAQKALWIGQALYPETRVLSIHDVAAYATLYDVALLVNPRDRYHQFIASLAQYDLDHHTDFVPTLERFIGCAGDIGKTASQLGIHRNTLTKRLLRMQDLFDLAVEDQRHWAALLVAVGVHQLHTQMRTR